MARRESDEFNFVGLARSPVKQTPGAVGYYDRGHIKSGGESFSAAKTERMSTGSIVGSSAASRRRQALQPVAANALNPSPTSKTPLASPSSLALLSSSISSKRSVAHAALAARRSSLPVSRTLKMSPALGGDDSTAGVSSVDRLAGHGATSNTPSHLCPDEASGYGPVSRLQRGRGGLFSPASADASLHTPHGSACSRSPASAHPATAARRQASQSESPSMTSSAFTPDHGFAKEYPCPASAIMHQPLTPVMADPDLSSTSAAGGGSTPGSDGGGDWSECSAVFSPEPATPAPPCSVHRSARGGRESSRKEVARTAEVAHNPSPARSESSTTSSRGGGSDSIRRSVARSPVLTAAQLVREDAPSTPAAAAALAAMMVGRAPAAVAVCETVEEGDWSDGGDLFSEGPLEVSMDVQVKPRATAPQSPLRTTAIAARRAAMTPRRPIAASALLELSAGTPRRMIRGIIGGVGPSGYSRQQQQQQSFVPSVGKVVENIEEETPRRYIKGVLADGQAAAANPAAHEPTSAPKLVGHSGCYSSASVAAAAAAATAAAAKTAAAAAAATAPPEESPDAQDVAAQSRDRVDGDASSVQQEVEVAVREEPVSVSVSSAVVSAERGAETRSCVSAPGVGKAVLKTVLVLSAIVLVVGALFVVFVLTCVVFAGPPLSVPIH